MITPVQVTKGPQKPISFSEPPAKSDLADVRADVSGIKNDIPKTNKKIRGRVIKDDEEDVRAKVFISLVQRQGL